MDTNKQESQPYNQTDHYHCWQEKKPPCGQRIEHLKCCLCEMLNPKAKSYLDGTCGIYVPEVESNEGVEEIEEIEWETPAQLDPEKLARKLNEIIRHLNTKKHE